MGAVRIVGTAETPCASGGTGSWPTWIQTEGPQPPWQRKLALAEVGDLDTAPVIVQILGNETAVATMVPVLATE